MRNNSDNKNDFLFFLFFMILNFIGVSLAVYFYKDKFLFWPYPFSYAGQSYTYETLTNNILSSRIYSADMILSGILMFYFSYKRFQVRNGKIMSWFLIPFVCGAGCIIAGFSPNDTQHTFHVIGSALLVAMLWIMASSYIYSVRDLLKGKNFYIWEAILQIPIFAYAITYFLGLDLISSIIQKFALAGLLLSLLYTTMLIRKSLNKTAF